MISAIVLAAGQASRFGQCKQLMRLGEKTLLQHALDHVMESNVDDVIVVLGARAEEIQQKHRFGRARVVINPDYAEGMSTSIQAGLRSLPLGTDAAMIVLADQPFVKPETLSLLSDEYRRTRPRVVIPSCNGFRGNPVIVDKALFPEMMNIRGDIGCRAVFGEHADAIARVPVDDRGVVTDIDTMEDFEAASSFGPATEVARSAPIDSDIAEAIVDLRRRRKPFAVATIVRAERPTSSKPGDKAIITPDGALTGWIGGSCAHDIVVRNALQSIEEGSPRFLTLSSDAPAEVSRRQGVIGVEMQCYSGGVLDVFIEPDLPRAHMVVVGYETVARALVRISKTLHFHVTVVDPLATPETVPEADEVVNRLSLSELPLSGESFIVIATHGRFDEEALEQAVQTTASYVALVASPKRAGVILRQLGERGVSREALDGIRSPAGLDIGAQGAEEIALSIVAQIVQERRAGKLKRPAAVVAPRTEAVDPICGMTVEVEGAQYTAEHEGRRYYFCCAPCQRTFEKEPDRYAHVA